MTASPAGLEPGSRSKPSDAERPAASSASLPRRWLLARPDASRTPAQKALLARWYRSIDPDWRGLDRRVRDHAANAPKPKVGQGDDRERGLPAVRLHTQGADFFEKTHLLKRGDLDPEAAARRTPGFLQVLIDASDGESRWQADAAAGAGGPRTAGRAWRTGSPTSTAGPGTCWPG